MKDISFGRNLKAMRKKAGMTRAALAQEIFYSEKSIEKWETGGSVPPVATVCRLAELFGVTVDSLLYKKDGYIKYILGIDGGGTKTELMLVNLHTGERRGLILGPSNPVDIGMSNTEKTLELGIRQITGGIEYSEIAVYAGLAGGITGNNRESIGKFLSGFGFGAVDNGSDTDNALAVALKGEDGIAVIMGTGVIAFAQIGGVRHRVGGWGYLMDRGGSGYNFGCDAINSALCEVDGRGGSKLMLELIEKRISKPIVSHISEFYGGGKTYIASFADIVFTAYREGDPEAKKIIDRNVGEVAEIIRACYRRANGKRLRTVICGGMCHHKDILKIFFKKHLADEGCVEFLNEPIIGGACMLAERLAKSI